MFGDQRLYPVVSEILRGGGGAELADLPSITNLGFVIAVKRFGLLALLRLSGNSHRDS